MAEAIQRDQYRLGDLSPQAWLAKRRVIIGGFLVLGAVIGLIVITLTQNVIVIICTAALAGLTWLIFHRRDDLGGRWLVTGLGQLVRTTVAGRAGWDQFDAQRNERPFSLEHVRPLAWSEPHADVEIGFLDCGLPDGHFVAALEIGGDGEGIHSAAEHSALEGVVPAVLRRLAAPGISVSQLSLITRAVPTDGSEYRAWQANRLRPDLPAELLESMNELGDQAERGSQEIRSWAVIVMPTSRLREDAFDRGLTADSDGLATAAAATLSKVSRAMTDEGMDTLRALSALELGGLVRGLWLPDRDVDDLAGIRGFWKAWPAFRPAPRRVPVGEEPKKSQQRSHRIGRYESVVATDPMTGQRWHHSVGTIPLKAWPSGPVLGRYLEPLVLTGGGVPFRTIAVSFSLIPQERARGLAKSQLTSAAARVIGLRRKRQVHTGEEEAVQSVAQMVATDVTQRGEAGVVVSLWADIAAKSPRVLARRREQVQQIVESSMTARRWQWQDGRHVPAMYAILPLGRKVQP